LQLHAPIFAISQEIFWATHHLFCFFFPLCIFHGGAGLYGFLGPNYYKFFVGSESSCDVHLCLLHSAHANFTR
jgi:hypothetical protein